jgi:hypothetical protein
MEYEAVWCLDCLTFSFLYLWLAVKLLRLACNPKHTWELIDRYVAPVVLYLWEFKIRPCLTFDTLFKLVIAVATVIILKHAFGHDFKIPQLRIISDIRPMANIWYDIYCPLRWLLRIVWC